MKKFTSVLLLVILILSQFQIQTLLTYADTPTLDTTKTTTIAGLDKVDDTVANALQIIDTKLTNEETKERLKAKGEEIKEYIADTQDKIQDARTSTQIKNTLQEAQKVVTLKIVSGVTEYTNVAENISDTIAPTFTKKIEAIDAIQDSLKINADTYFLIIKSKNSISQVNNFFANFDKNIRVSFSYEHQGESYFEVKIPSTSVFRQEMLEDIEKGELPEGFLGIEVVSPNVFPLNEITSPVLPGEDLASTWGVQSYHPENYLTALKNTNRQIRVGIIDTGVDAKHSDLQGRVVSGYDFVNDDSDPTDDQGHGTHVAGVIAGSNNGQGIIGVNPSAQIVPLKICTASGMCPSYGILRALEYAKNQHIEVVNMSLGGLADPSTDPICASISDATQGGMIVVAAAGNSNVDASTFVPGGCAGVLTVGAVDSQMNRAIFSNYGPRVDVSAPGVDIYSTYLQGSYKKMSGTSMATPHITGLISVMKAFNPNLNLSDIKNIFANNSLTVGFSPEKVMPKFADGGKIVAGLVGITQTQPLPSPPLAGEGIATTPTQSKDVAILDRRITHTAWNPNGNVVNTPVVSNQVQVASISPSKALDGSFVPMGIRTEVNTLNSTNINITNTNNLHIPLVYNPNVFSQVKQSLIYGIPQTQNIDETLNNVLTINTTAPQTGKNELQINNVQEGVEFVSKYEIQNENALGNFSGKPGSDIYSYFFGKSQFIPTQNIISPSSIQQIQSDTTMAPLPQSQEVHIGEYANRLEAERLKNPPIENPLPKASSINPENLIEIQKGTLSPFSPDAGGVTIQDIQTCNIYLYEYCKYPLTNANKATYTPTDIVSIVTTSADLSLIPRRVGKVDIQISQNGKVYHTINVEVKASKELKVDTTPIALTQGDTYYRTIQDGNGNYDIRTKTTSLKATFYSTNVVKLEAQQYTIFDDWLRIADQGGQEKYIWVTIKPKIFYSDLPLIDQERTDVMDITGYQYEIPQDGSIQVVEVSPGKIKIQALKPGNSYFRLKKYDYIFEQKNITIATRTYPLVVDNTYFIYEKDRSYTATITSGNGGYLDPVSDTPNIEAKIVGNTITMTAKDYLLQPTHVTITDKKNQKQIITLWPKMLSEKDEYPRGKISKYPSGGLNVEPGEGTNIIGVSKDANGDVLIDGKAVGVGTFYLTGQGGYRFGKVTITIFEKTFDLKVNRNNLVIQEGTTHTINIIDGNGGYTIVSPVPNILTAKLIGDPSKIEGVSIEINAQLLKYTNDYVNLTLSDIKDQHLFIRVKVQPLLREYTDTITQGEAIDFNFTPNPQGWKYIWENNDDNKASFTYIDQGIKISGDKPGTTTLYITNGVYTFFKKTLTILPPPQQLTLESPKRSIYEGDTSYIYIQSGNGGYSINSTANISASVTSNTNTPNIPMSHIVVKGNKTTNGYETLTLTDSRNKTANISVQVLPRMLDYSCTIKIGESCEIPFKAGTNTFVSDKEGIVTAETNSIGNTLLRGINIGTSNIYAKQGDTYLAKIYVNVVANPNQTTITPIQKTYESYVGEYVYIPMPNANEYTANSPQVGIVQLYNNTQYIVYQGLQAGTTVITVKKNGSIYYEYTITVKEKQVLSTVGGATQELYLNKPFSLPLTGGNGTYRLWAYPTDMLDMSVNNSTLNLKLLNIPNSPYPYFTVTDSAGMTLAKRIIPLLNEVVLEKEVIEVGSGSTADLNVIDGNGDYTVYKNNGNVDVSQVSDTKFMVKGVSIGESVVEVKDGYGKGKTVVVKVLDTSPKFEILNYGKASNENGLSALYFKIIGSYQEVGLQYQDENGQIVRQELTKQDDNVYLIGLEENIYKNSSNKFQPYIISGDKTYYYQEKYLSFEDNGIGLANTEQHEMLIINSISETYQKVKGNFIDLKNQIKILKEENQGYIDGSQKALVELVTDLIDTPEAVISLIKTSGKVLWAYINGDRLVSDDINKAQAILGDLYGTVKDAYEKFERYTYYLNEYETKYISSYVGTSMSLMIVSPGKLKIAKSTNRVVKTLETIAEKGILTKFSKISITLPIDVLQHIKDRHLIGGIDYKPGITSYFNANEDIPGLISSFTKDGIKEAKNGSYSITKNFNRNIGYDRDIGKDTNVMTIILKEDGSIVTSHPGLPTTY